MTFALIDFLLCEKELASFSIEAKQEIKLLSSRTLGASQMCFATFSLQPLVRENLIYSS